MISDSISRRGAIAGGACLAAMAGIAGTTAPRAAKADDVPDFQTIVDGLEDDEQTCCTVYEDGSGILIDTNPDDTDGGISLLYSMAGSSAIDKVFEQLGLPKILTGMFGQCSASDGWQTRTRGSYEISWKYHPDAGLRVFIEWLG